MKEEYNKYQIIRKDARGCFVESLYDFFDKGKAHFAFTKYNVNLPEGQRQTDYVHIFIGVDELVAFCLKLQTGELRYLVNQKRQNGDNTPLEEWLGGMSAEKLKTMGKAREDGKSLSRTAKLLVGNKSDFLFVADSGPGEQNTKGLIVPKFGKNPENHVTVSLAWEALSELFLVTKIHYQAWLSARYAKILMEAEQENDPWGQSRESSQPRVAQDWSQNLQQSQVQSQNPIQSQYTQGQSIQQQQYQQAQQPQQVQKAQSPQPPVQGFSAYQQPVPYQAAG